MIILAVETSCDDTSIALIKFRPKKRTSFDILSSVVSSQTEIHKKWGGVYPTLAKREHQKNLIPVLEKALKKAKKFKTVNYKLKIENSQLKTFKKILAREPELLDGFLKFIPKIRKPEIKAIALTVGPGLEPCLWVGINFAKTLAYCWNLPIIPVNHVESHIFSAFLNRPIPKRSIFPAVCLVVSGGHTQLILIKNFGQYKILGETQDDAAGECLDKTARILGLGYPGGPAIAKKAAQFKISNLTLRKAQNNTRRSRSAKFKIDLPRPMIKSNNYNFSFSGLKTAVLYEFKKRTPRIRKNKEYIRELCAETQQAVIDVLIYKTLKAVKNYKVKTIILGGGVTANKELRKQFNKKIKKDLPDVEIFLPDFKFCTDNAAMTALNSFFRLREKKNWQKIKARADSRID